MTPKTTNEVVAAVVQRAKQRPEHVLRLITQDQEMGLAPVAWSWEQWGGMCNAFVHDPRWEADSDDGRNYWVERGFVAPRPLHIQTPLQAAAPQMLIQLKALIHISNATNWEGHTCGEIARARALVERVEEFIALQSIKEPSQ